MDFSSPMDSFPFYLLCLWPCSAVFSTAYSNKRLLTSIQDTSEGVVSLAALDRYDDNLVEWLQEWGSGIGQVLSLNNQLGETKVLQVPWGVLKHKEHFEL